jgi:hypothetical protein
MFGVLFLLLALCATLLPLIKPVRDIMPFKVIPLLWFIGSALLLTLAFMCLLCGTTISMLSGLSLAIRDMARNSFHEPLPTIESAQRQQPSTLTIEKLPRDVIDTSTPQHLLPTSA